MARALWKGAISFGLVNIPVEMYGAEDRKSFSFSMLDKKDLAPVGYKRYNKSTGKEVAWGDIVKGYEYSKGEYVVLSDEDFKQANVKATQTIDIRAIRRCRRDSARVLRDAVLPGAGAARRQGVRAFARDAGRDGPRRGGRSGAAHDAASRRRVPQRQGADVQHAALPGRAARRERHRAAARGPEERRRHRPRKCSSRSGSSTT
jgi:hypothetical protein